MSDCPTCGYPRIWSDDRRRVWCAVWGNHLAPVETTPARYVNALGDTERRLRAVS